ncbi:MAG: hypothetical protein KatS3mg108_1662 [Isosphaeraceae bacterium]|jgi:hypothetical protein|nr:MAG: hypothetical protein KatS3mg108_1662 [Isosphaeraceae bacterium]
MGNDREPLALERGSALGYCWRLALVAALGLAGPDRATLGAQDLGAPRYAEREAASATLREGGAEALARLRAARQSSDPEVRWRAEEVLEMLEARSLLEPMRIEGLESITRRDDAVRLLEQATGVRFRMQNAVLAPLPATFEPAPTFWEVLDALELDADWTLESDPRRVTTPAETIWRLSARQPMPPDAIQGPYRLVLREVGFAADPDLPRSRLSQPARSSRDLILRVDLLSEPRLRFRLIEPIRVLAATDSAGRITHVEAETAEPELRPGATNSFAATASRAIRLRPIRGTHPKRLVFRVTLEAETRREEPVVIPLESTADSAILTQPVRLDDALISSLRIDRPPGVPGWALDVTIQPDDFADFLARRRFGRQQFDLLSQILDRPMRQFELIGAEGEPVRFDLARRIVPVAQGFRMIATLDLPANAPPPQVVHLFNPIRGVSEWTFVIEDPSGP